MRKFCLLIALAAICCCCEDIFEKNISTRIVSVVSPLDSVVTPEGKVSFLWRPVSDATMYHLTIVSPSFERASMLIADTLLMTFSPSDTTMTDSEVSTKGVRFDCVMTEGVYQWRVKAMNNGYSSKENTLTLYVTNNPSIDKY